MEEIVCISGPLKGRSRCSMSTRNSKLDIQSSKYGANIPYAPRVGWGESVRILYEGSYSLEENNSSVKDNSKNLDDKVGLETWPH